MDRQRYEFIGWEALLEVWTPRVLGAIVILLVAWFVGKALKAVLARGVDKLPGAARTNEGADPKHTIGARLGEVALWLVLLVGVVAALGVLNLTGAVGPLNTLLNDIAAFVPHILGAALIFFVGFILATLAKRLTVAALEAANADRWLDRMGLQRTTGAVGLTGAVGTLVFVLILIPVTIAALEQLSIASITEPATAVLGMVLAALPRVLVAGILLAIGFFIGRWVASIIERVLPATGFDRSLSSLTGLSSMKRDTDPAPAGTAPYAGDVSPAYAAKLRAEGEGQATPLTPSKVVANLAMIAIVIFFAIEAARQLQFAAFAGVLESILELAGRVLIGGVIITAGVVIADLLANLINRTTGGADRFASTLVRWATIALATAMGLSFMGIADEIVVLAFGLILGSAAVAAALAFGLGGREWAGRMLNRWTPDSTSSGAPRAPRTPRTRPIDPEI